MPKVQPFNCFSWTKALSGWYSVQNGHGLTLPYTSKTTALLSAHRWSTGASKPSLRANRTGCVSFQHLPTHSGYQQGLVDREEWFQPVGQPESKVTCPAGCCSLGSPTSESFPHLQGTSTLALRSMWLTVTACSSLSLLYFGSWMSPKVHLLTDWSSVHSTMGR